MTTRDAGSDKRTRVVTRLGDAGQTQVGKGRMLKCAPRVEAYGAVDEANSVIGVLRTAVQKDERLGGWLRLVQIDLFDIGADLSMPGDAGALLRFRPEPVARIEAQLDELNAAQPRIANFLLPTGADMAGAYAHLARAVTRRAERRVVALAQIAGEEVNPEIPRYLNRLSDFLFIMARHLNDDGAKDDVWAPRGQR
ncbi:ATP:cob(I)alamin adenosyltransferase [Roseiarcus fermentans]|uniref:Corrinoid adenosyltransferase n=1 Tax=Roseiarcus fermentans TaxID=1473586 RepID=A0A366F709_9HYPH|nr:cob(I)yrinic acid a,c-diamide adenosyltransferase [Roseiarcus fermentans]RBP09926.1 ATP:cob(I)alamin adenosyltransferase [Roseiarcus fermentans]